MVVLFSCEKEAIAPHGKLTGTCNVTKLEGQQYVLGVQGIYLADNNPTGTIKFERNGNGKQDYSFVLFGTTYPQYANFKWTATTTTINVNRINDTDLVWERLLSEEHKQIAAYDIIVDASSTIKYTLTLEK